MVNLNVPSELVSVALLRSLSDIGLHTITHYNLTLHIDGTPEQIAEAQALVASFDLAAGIWADRTRVYEQAVQAHLDAAAQALGYDNILSACSYAGYTNPFQTEGQSFVSWRGAVWDYCYAQLAAVQAGTRTQPTVDELIAELPARA